MSMRRAPPPDGALLSPSWSSSFSSKYSVNQMLESPMPSPALPSIVPRHGKKPRPNHLRNALRRLLPMSKWICGLLILGWVLTSRSSWRILPLITGDSSLNENCDLMNEERSPEHPMPIFIANSKGRPRLSISLPKHLPYPLRPSEYSFVCSRYEDAARRLQQQKSHSGFYHNRGFHKYYYTDPNFMDVREAEEHGFLPVKQDDGTLPSQQTSDEEKSLSMKHLRTDGKICEKTLTHVLETTDAGIGKTMMSLWLSYGLAQEEGRAFFIDDSNWSYGKYTDLFKPPPTPFCLPPPPHHRLPCPHHARHLLVSAATSQWTFGEAFREHFQNSEEPKAYRQKRIFGLMRVGYEALFHLAPEDAAYATSRLSELDGIRLKGRRIVGVNVRRGNRHPWEYQYQDSYTPLETYADAADAFLTQEFHPGAKNSSAVPQSEKSPEELDSVTLLASDDPDVHSTPELSHTRRAQSHISLANKAALDAASPLTVPRSSNSEVIFSKFVDGNVGWEGGFFPSVFWGLGNAAAGSTAARGLRNEREDPAPSELSLSLRGLVARAYLLDLKILGASDAVVCGVSSIGCRLLAVMLGWQKGIVQGRWKNVDGGYGWTAFEKDNSF
ncbi:MAG: hypothetical protein Q9195_001789 [Heterodermia aff. obscurata]